MIRIKHSNNTVRAQLGLVSLVADYKFKYRLSIRKNRYILSLNLLLIHSNLLKIFIFKVDFLIDTGIFLHIISIYFFMLILKGFKVAELWVVADQWCWNFASFLIYFVRRGLCSWCFWSLIIAKILFELLSSHRLWIFLSPTAILSRVLAIFNNLCGNIWRYSWVRK
jgi:hypothetical protein